MVASLRSPLPFPLATSLYFSEYCEVLELQIPSGLQFRSTNRGFAFATVVCDVPVSNLITKLDGADVDGRPLHVRLSKD